MNKLGYILVLTAMMAANAVSVNAQDGWTDTLKAAVKTDAMKVARDIVSQVADVEAIRAVVTPLGEGDPVKWVQTLPGVTTGADGTTAFYVRGGNMGNNLITLDGVPVYGYSHLLGLTTSMPQQVIGSSELQKGGFTGMDNNFTASHLKIVTRNPEKGFDAGVSLNNFFVGANAEANFNDRISFMLSARISPLTLEYKAVQGILPSLIQGVGDLDADIGDLYAKLRVKIIKDLWFEGSTLLTKDRYEFSAAEDSRDMIGWSNTIALARVYYERKKSLYEMAFSYNDYGNSQEQEKLYRGEANLLSLSSGLSETTYRAQGSNTFGRRDLFSVGYGVKTRRSAFSPGHVGTRGDVYRIDLTNLYLQTRFNLPERLDVWASVRYNIFNNIRKEWDGKITKLNGQSHFEESLYMKLMFGPHVALEGTFDNMVQYYHTLEGLPVGWNLDMLLHSDTNLKPETALQATLGTSLTFGKHSGSAGVFYKEMDNLVFYEYATSLFDSRYNEWINNICQGQGLSYGAEFLYEYCGRDLYARASYTLSKSTRSGFANVGEGAEFNAKFDRPHVFNAMARWKGISAAVTWMSGHWENGAPETYQLELFGDIMWVPEYYSTVNNFRMPTVFRLDLGYQFSFNTGPARHDVNLGVCNVTNHFNPFMLYFDNNDEKWKMLALLPILPNFSYRVNF
jgi:hypothetical protein